MSVANPVLLDVSGLSSGYGKIGVLRDVSFDLRAGEVVALLGPNGAGKTTLLGSLTGLVGDLTAGSVMFGGIDLTGCGPRQSVAAGMLQVVEGHRVFTSMSVEDNLLLGGFGIDRRPRDTRIQEAYGVFPELADKRSAKAGTLSGGQQQMLVIAQALIRSPRLLMLDEPSAGLSPVLVDRILQLARQLGDDGLAVVIVEQMVEKVLAVSDRAIVLSQGVVTYDGLATDLAGNDELRHAYLG